MSQFLQITVASDIFASVMSLFIATGIALFYVRYLRRQRVPLEERKWLDAYGFFILGTIFILLGLGGIAFAFYSYTGISILIAFIVSCTIFTSLFVFSAMYGYKKS